MVTTAMTTARFVLFAVQVSLFLPATSIAAQGGDEALEFFEARVRPVLALVCHECHSGDSPKSGLNLEARDGFLAGGALGPAIVPGKPEESRLVRAIRYDDAELQMPPRGKLRDADIESLIRWIEMGAPWPEGEMKSKPENESSDVKEFNLWKRRGEHWCWRPIVDHPPPDVGDASWPRNPLDRFLLARLESEGLRPAPEADKETLIRRLYFDLVGLPPAPEDVDAFLADTAPDACERLVASLLESPRFGERWARHFMDLVRYAETYGHEFDYPIEHAWQYRDYLIRAFNADVPYDRFILEQVAGDLLESPRRHPTEDFNESVLGTGHWFLHQATHAPVDVRNDQAERIDNQIDVLSKTFMALTVSCARCHDHKFDAISTRDFYSLYGIVKSSRRQVALLDPGGKIERARDELRDIAARENRRLLAGLSGAGALLDMTPHLRACARIPELFSTEVLFEADALAVLEKTAGEYRRQDLSAERWTGGGQMWWTGAREGERLVLSLPVAEKGEYELFVALTKAFDYGIVRISVDGVSVGEPIDLYHPEVTPTGRLSLGIHPLAAGEHRLGFEILGANEKASKLFMVGIDHVVLVPKSSERAYEDGLQAAAADEGIRVEDLRPLVETLGDSSLSSARHPLFAWAEVTRKLRALEVPPAEKTAAFNTVRAELLESWKRRIADAEDARGGESPRTFEDFKGSSFAGWTVAGEAFGDGPTKASDVALDAESGRVRLLEPHVAHGGSFAKKLQGALRSPTFTIDSDFIHYRMLGDGGQIRLIIEGYTLDVQNSLLFEGMSFDVRTGGKWTWHEQRVKKHRGHRAHIEILDQGDGFVAVDEIVFANGSRADVACLDRAIADLEVSSSLASLARLMNRRIRVSLRDARGSELDEGQVLLVNTWLDHGLPGQDSSLSRMVDLQRYRRLIDEMPRPMQALAWCDSSGEDEYVFVRGRHMNVGPDVPRRFLEAVAGPDQPRIERGSGRLELARWLIDPRNPLTTRVIVNRLWKHLFGAGIVRTVDNFGVLGEPPSHPELLDWLAQWFATEGRWSIKKTLYLFATSSAYRMSSMPGDPLAEEKDPGNVFLHRMAVKRLEGEALRDAILSVSGRLDLTMYGPSVPIHLTEFMDGRGRPEHTGPLDGNGRRSVYIEVRRNFLSPMMLAFDTPTPFSTVGMRSVSNVPAQALILMNDPLVIAQAEVWAKKALSVPDRTREQRVVDLHRSAFARPPSAADLEQALDFLETQARTYETTPDDPKVLADLCHVLFNVKEFAFVH